MRITDELKNRINRRLDAKYANEVKENDQRWKDAKKAKLPEIVFSLTFAINTIPAVSIVVSMLYNSSRHPETRYSETNVATFVYDRSTTFLPEDWQEYNRVASSIKDRKKMDYEELAIAISYQKDLNGIKETFANMGLTF